MYVVHPNLGVTSTKRCRMRATFIFIRRLQFATEKFPSFFLNLTGSHLGSTSSGIESYKILDRIFYICIFIFLGSNYNSVHENVYIQ